MESAGDAAERQPCSRVEAEGLDFSAQAGPSSPYESSPSPISALSSQMFSDVIITINFATPAEITIRCDDVNTIMPDHASERGQQLSGPLLLYGL